MPRIARIVVPGHPHHITQRGNYRQTVFVKDTDYTFYLQRLNEYIVRHKLSILAYCLMPNHVHFVCIPEHEHSLAKTLNACHMRYAHYFNKKRRLTGHLWEGRGLLSLADINHFMEVDDWSDYLSEKEKEKVIKDIRMHTLNGRPLGNSAFIAKLEDLYGKRFKALPRGRPKKK